MAPELSKEQNKILGKVVNKQTQRLEVHTRVLPGNCLEYVKQTLDPRKWIRDVFTTFGVTNPFSPSEPITAVCVRTCDDPTKEKALRGKEFQDNTIIQNFDDGSIAILQVDGGSGPLGNSPGLLASRVIPREIMSRLKIVIDSGKLSANPTEIIRQILFDVGEDLKNFDAILEAYQEEFNGNGHTEISEQPKKTKATFSEFMDAHTFPQGQAYHKRPNEPLETLEERINFEIAVKCALTVVLPKDANHNYERVVVINVGDGRVNAGDNKLKTKKRSTRALQLVEKENGPHEIIDITHTTEGQVLIAQDSKNPKVSTAEETSSATQVTPSITSLELIRKRHQELTLRLNYGDISQQEYWDQMEAEKTRILESQGPDQFVTAEEQKTLTKNAIGISVTGHKGEIAVRNMFNQGLEGSDIQVLTILPNKRELLAKLEQNDLTDPFFDTFFDGRLINPRKIPEILEGIQATLSQDSYAKCLPGLLILLNDPTHTWESAKNLLKQFETESTIEPSTRKQLKDALRKRYLTRKNSHRDSVVKRFNRGFLDNDDCIRMATDGYAEVDTPLSVEQFREQEIARLRLLHSYGEISQQEYWAQVEMITPHYIEKLAENAETQTGDKSKDDKSIVVTNVGELRKFKDGLQQVSTKLLLEKIITMLQYHQSGMNHLPVEDLHIVQERLYTDFFYALDYSDPRKAKEQIITFCNNYPGLPLIEMVRRITEEHFTFSRVVQFDNRNYGNNIERSILFRLLGVLAIPMLPLMPKKIRAIDP